jgi:nucleotide-binding universal stress UspA family protein
MIKSILVALDGSAHSASAREHALALARVYDARVVGMHVLDVRMFELPPLVSSAYMVESSEVSTRPMEILAGFRENGDRLLEEFREAASSSGVTLELRLEEGVPAQTIAELADAHDLVVIGKRGAHARFGEDLVGSTAEEVARRSGSPVLLVERDPVTLQTIRVLYDGSHGANEALKLSADLTSHISGSLLVITGSGTLEEAGDVQLEARGYLSAFDLVVDYRVFTGDPVLGALDMLEEQPGDLVVLGRHSHNRLRSLILGSTTGELLHRLRGPVLVTA